MALTTHLGTRTITSSGSNNNNRSSSGSLFDPFSSSCTLATATTTATAPTAAALVHFPPFSEQELLQQAAFLSTFHRPHHHHHHPAHHLYPLHTNHEPSPETVWDSKNVYTCQIPLDFIPPPAAAVQAVPVDATTATTAAAAGCEGYDGRGQWFQNVGSYVAEAAVVRGSLETPTSTTVVAADAASAPERFEERFHLQQDSLYKILEPGGGGGAGIPSDCGVPSVGIATSGGEAGGGILSVAPHVLTKCQQADHQHPHHDGNGAIAVGSGDCVLGYSDVPYPSSVSLDYFDPSPDTTLGLCSPSSLSPTSSPLLPQLGQHSLPGALSATAAVDPFRSPVTHLTDTAATTTNAATARTSSPQRLVPIRPPPKTIRAASTTSSSGGGFRNNNKTDLKRLRNRVSASRCRLKRKAFITDLEKGYGQLVAQRERLRACVAEWEERVRRLEELVRRVRGVGVGVGGLVR